MLVAAVPHVSSAVREQCKQEMWRGTPYRAVTGMSFHSSWQEKEDLCTPRELQRSAGSVKL